MSQLNFYVPKEVEKTIRQEARARGKTISNYLAEIVKGHVRQDEWRKDFFTQVVGQWKGDFPEIERPMPDEPIHL